MDWLPCADAGGDAWVDFDVRVKIPSWGQLCVPLRATEGEKRALRFPSLFFPIVCRFLVSAVMPMRACLARGAVRYLVTSPLPQGTHVRIWQGIKPECIHAMNRAASVLSWRSSVLAYVQGGEGGGELRMRSPMRLCLASGNVREGCT